MAMAGPNYEVLYADIGSKGHISDGGVWNKSGFVRVFRRWKLELKMLKQIQG